MRFIVLYKRKEDSLNDDEYNIIKGHPEIGYRLLNSVPDFKDVADIILSHHERIDGKGYPNGLKDNDIPYISKIISICDAYDAMIGKKHYRKPFPKAEAIKELRMNSGTQFDKDLVEIFINKVINKD